MKKTPPTRNEVAHRGEPHPEGRASEARLSIIIVNWNTGRLLAQCIKSLAQLSDRHVIHQVVVVDNASTDTSLTQAQSVITDVDISYITSSINLGFARANNVGMAQIKNQNDHVLLLNPDTQVQAGALSTLLQALQQESTNGIVGARLLNPDHTTQQSVRQFPSLVVFILLFLKLHHILPHLYSWKKYMMAGFNYDLSATVDQVMGAAMLVRRQAWDQLKGLDGGFFVWFEEVDFCRRAKQSGWQTSYIAEATIVHHGGVSFNQVLGWRKSLLWIRSCLRYSRKHIPLGWPLLVALSPVALCISTLAGIINRRTFSPTNGVKI